MSPTRIAKAIVATIGAAATAVLGLVPDGSTGWVIATIVVACVTALGTYLLPNKQPAARRGE
jgi:hypothetical protein